MRMTLKNQLESEYTLKDFLARRCNKCLKALNCSLIKKALKGQMQSGLVLEKEKRGSCTFEVVKCRDYRPCLPSVPKKAYRQGVIEERELFPDFVDMRKWG